MESCGRSCPNIARRAPPPELGINMSLPANDKLVSDLPEETRRRIQASTDHGHSVGEILA